MDKLLHQQEAACSLNNLDDQNEIHIAGDMNLDALGGRWLSPGYSLLSLAKMVENVCNSFNLTQLVKEPTRKQFNSVDATKHQSCIDHIYTNVKHRCSNPEIISFGASDHDLISYIRYSKEPPSQAKTVRKRSYKSFDAEKYIADLNQTDFTEVLICHDIDKAVAILTEKIKQVLDRHAPWVIFQQRKNFAPWLTGSTLEMMKERDALKAKASKLAAKGQNASELWSKYKRLRNTINTPDWSSDKPLNKI